MTVHTPSAAIFDQWSTAFARASAATDDAALASAADDLDRLCNDLRAAPVATPADVWRRVVATLAPLDCDDDAVAALLADARAALADA